MKKDRLIFLDIDGVVNTLIINTKPFKSRNGQIERDGFYFDLCNSSDERVSNIQAIIWLNKLCKDTGARIVITSTWRGREGNYKDINKYLCNSGLLDDIIVEGATPWLDGPRGKEILCYLQKNYPNGVNSYVILDDDTDMKGCENFLVKCDTFHGFGYPEYLKAKQILEK